MRTPALLLLTALSVSSLTTPLLAMPLRSDYSDGSCEDLLSHPGLRRAVQVLNREQLPADQKAHALQMLQNYADSHANSFEFILALEPKAPDLAYDRNLGYDERVELITTYLSRDENARLAAEHVYYLWEKLLKTITQNPRGLSRARLDSARQQLSYLLKLARSHGDLLLASWSLHVWDSERKGPHLVDWKRANLDRVIEYATHDLLTRKTHHEDPKKQVKERNEYVGRLIKILETPVRDEKLESLIRFDFATDQRAMAQNRTYAADMAQLFDSEGDDPNVPFGNFLVALTYRATKLFEAASDRPRLPSSIALDQRLAAWDAADRASREIEQRFVDPTYDLEPDQRAVVSVVERDPLFRATLFKNSPLTGDLLEPRAWLSVLDPARVRRAVDALDKASGLYATFARDLKSSLGVPPAQLANDDVYYTYYPDEIWDALPKAARPSGDSGGEPEPATTLRFARREPSDLSLGDKTGDCTAVGSVNYGNSLTWWYNSAYQVLRFKRGGSWLGKIHVALFEIDRSPALKIDAIEVSPQAQMDSGPQRAEAELGLRDALTHVFAMGDRLHRRVYAETSSNTAWVNKLIFDLRHASEADASADDIDDGFEPSTPIPPKTGVFIFDQVGVRRALGLPADVALKPYYQTAERAFMPPTEFKAPIGPAVAVDAKLQTFASQIVDPARATDDQLDRALSEARGLTDEAARDARFTDAAKILLGDPARESAVKTLFGLPAAYAVSPKLIVKRLIELAPVLDPTKGERSGGFVMNSATFLMHEPTAKR